MYVYSHYSASWHRTHGVGRDECRNNFYQREFNYDHSKYLIMQRLCVDGYIRQSNALPMVVSGIVNKYMPQKEKWECYYQHGRCFNRNSIKYYYPSEGNKWE